MATKTKTTKEQIFGLLIGSEDYLSGEAISESLGISRAAVWKHIKSLEEEGYAIEAVRNLGYKIAANGLKEAEIIPYMSTEWLGKNQVYVSETTSTIDLAKEYAEKGAENGLAVFADVQTAGRGRLGRPWSSPKGAGIWLAVLLRPKIAPHVAPQFTLATAVGVANGLKELGFEVGIKWPNDLLIGGKKICGILTEMRADMERVHWVVVGIGVNALNLDFPQELKDIATSLVLNSKQPVLRGQVAGVLLNHLENAYETLEAGGFEAIRNQWLMQNITLGKMVRITTIDQEYTALAKTMNSDGHLVVELPDGESRTVVAGYVAFAEDN